MQVLSNVYQKALEKNSPASATMQCNTYSVLMKHYYWIHLFDIEVWKLFIFVTNWTHFVMVLWQSIEGLRKSLMTFNIWWKNTFHPSESLDSKLSERTIAFPADLIIKWEKACKDPRFRHIRLDTKWFWYSLPQLWIRWSGCWWWFTL